MVTSRLHWWHFKELQSSKRDEKTTKKEDAKNKEVVDTGKDKSTPEDKDPKNEEVGEITETFNAKNWLAD